MMINSITFEFYISYEYRLVIELGIVPKSGQNPHLITEIREQHQIKNNDWDDWDDWKEEWHQTNYDVEIHPFINKSDVKDDKE